MMEQILVEYVQHYIDPVTLQMYLEIFMPVFKKVVQAICPKSTTDDTDLLSNDCNGNDDDRSSNNHDKEEEQELPPASLDSTVVEKFIRIFESSSNKVRQENFYTEWIYHPIWQLQADKRSQRKIIWQFR